MIHNALKEQEKTDDSQIYKRLHKYLHAGCALCPWHSGENIGRRPKHGEKKKRKRWNRDGLEDAYR